MSSGLQHAESSLLGSILLDNSVLDRVCDIVSPDDFRNESLGFLLGVMSSLRDEGVFVDSVSIAERMDTLGRLEEFGGIGSILELDNQVTSVSAENYAKIIRGHSKLRNVINAASDLGLKAMGTSHGDVNLLVDGAVDTLMGITDTSDVSMVPLSEAVDTAITETQERHENKTAVIGVTTGLSRLDSILGGFLDSNSYILSAGTGKGKSALGLGFALAALHSGKRVVYVSLEMSSTDLARRLISIESQVDGENIRTGYLNEIEVSEILHASKTLKQFGDALTIIDKPGLHVSSLRRICRRQNSASGVDLVIVDYLQLLGADDAFSREQQVATISKGLLSLCREVSCPVVALSQVNADGEIRESRAVSHDAAAIMRIDYEEDTDLDDLAPSCTIRVLKHRHGRTGNVPVTFYRNKQTFVQESRHFG